MAVAAAWVLFGLVAGTAEWLAVFRPLGHGWLAAAWSPLLAALIWIPLTLGVVSLGSRWPLWPPCASIILLHVTASLAISFVVNFVWGIGAALLHTAGFGAAGTTWADVVPATQALGLQYLHFNGGMYWLIVLAVTVWRHRFRDDARPTGAGPGPEWVETLTVKRGAATVMVPVADIDWIEGAGDYARLHVAGDRLLSNQRLKALERQLDPRVFARVHRSAIVNLTRIRQLSHQSHGDYLAVLEDGTAIKVARSRRQHLDELLRR